jgi:hypothetical protein
MKKFSGLWGATVMFQCGMRSCLSHPNLRGAVGEGEEDDFVTELLELGCHCSHSHNSSVTLGRALA